MSFVRIKSLNWYFTNHTSLTITLTLTLGSPRVNQGQEPLAQSRALNPTTLCTLISGLLCFYSGHNNIVLGSLYYHMRVRISVLLPVIYQSSRLPSASNVARAISWSTVSPGGGGWRPRPKKLKRLKPAGGGALSCTICFANSLTCGLVLIWELRISFHIRLARENRGGESKSVMLGFRCLKQCACQL